MRIGTTGTLAAVMLGAASLPASAGMTYNECLTASDANMPAWVNEAGAFKSGMLKRLGMISVFKFQDKNPSPSREERCGCHLAQVDWEPIKRELPDWFFTEEVSTPRFVEARKQAKTDVRRWRKQHAKTHCMGNG